jgi:hypothetical protein
MNMEFVIKSLISDRKLVFSDSDPYDDYFRVELRGSVSAGVTVYAHIYARDAKYFREVFQELGQLDKPWGGHETWVSIESDFSLSISCDKLGHVCFEVKMQLEQAQPEEAYISANLMTDLSAMPSIAEEAQKFFAERSPPASGA